MRVRFWGTRGSLPVALTSADIRDRLAQALLAAGEWLCVVTDGVTEAMNERAEPYGTALRPRDFKSLFSRQLSPKVPKEIALEPARLRS